jgi:hypothetical protein
MGARRQYGAACSELYGRNRGSRTGLDIFLGCDIFEVLFELVASNDSPHSMQVIAVV